jgi:hypothetical protein
MKEFIFAIAITSCVRCFAQQEEEKSSLDFSGYLEIYYLYDFNKPQNHTRPDFVYSYNRANEFNLNLGFIKGRYSTDKLRANLVLMSGTYSNANTKNEQGVLKNIFEANVGIKLSQKKNIWIDAGIFPSHIGFESAVGKDCWNLTRSILADNSPYYESGVKLSYTTDNGKWFLSGLILNGWQRIQMVDGNSMPSFGTQVTFKPSPSLTLNNSSFIGTDKPDSARLMRYFNNFYSIVQLSEKIDLTLGFDYGFEEKYANRNGFNIWYSPVVILRAKLTDKLTTALRGEYYKDENAVIIKNKPFTGFQTTGFSLNLDYQIVSNALWRIEIRDFMSEEKVFVRREKVVANSLFITTSIAVGF